MINSSKLYLETMSRLHDELHRIYLRIVAIQTKLDEMEAVIKKTNDEITKNYKATGK